MVVLVLRLCVRIRLHLKYTTFVIHLIMQTSAYFSDGETSLLGSYDMGFWFS